MPPPPRRNHLPDCSQHQYQPHIRRTRRLPCPVPMDDPRSKPQDPARDRFLQPFLRSRSFLSFSGHSGDLVTALYTRNRVPRTIDDFPYTILQEVPIQPSGQLCVNVTIPFETKVDEMGVIYFEARDPNTGNVEHYCSDVKMADIEALPEDHPAMCAANNETIIPMPDEYL
ncbi:hypothetical protein N7447_003331 [Penicillium robsamsonii]|uniref:uncharacterized protein n=1 Tax=Penicillium robsamsonii TaxID=1792511 RepID=UPI0025488AB9|nr:uncharacterized protein N7447_003331 [Penicillium robsamsonii]KAJ5826568.1 hypothetical protein N7447_003331 [Penicillium robsamsonii]